MTPHCPGPLAAMDALNLLVVLSVLLLAQTALIFVLIIRHRCHMRGVAATRRHYAALTRGARLPVVAELAASIVHEMTQPLSAILSNVETAELLLQSPDPKLAVIMEILSDVRHDDLRAYHIVKGLRSLLSTRELKRESIEINTLITEVLRLVRPDAVRRAVVIQTQLDAGLPTLLADPVHLQQVLLNLIVNAMQAMRDTPSADRVIEVRTRMQGSAVRVEIMDNGRGVSLRHGDALFDPFFTTKAEGMGLGLALARSIISLHGGSIWFENRSQGGAAFIFTLPTRNPPSRPRVFISATRPITMH